MIQCLIRVTIIGVDHRMAVVMLCMVGIVCAWDLAFGEDA